MDDDTNAAEAVDAAGAEVSESECSVAAPTADCMELTAEAVSGAGGAVAGCWYMEPAAEDVSGAGGAVAGCWCSPSDAPLFDDDISAAAAGGTQRANMRGASISSAAATAWPKASGVGTV